MTKFREALDRARLEKGPRIPISGRRGGSGLDLSYATSFVIDPATPGEAIRYTLRAEARADMLVARSDELTWVVDFGEHARDKLRRQILGDIYGPVLRAVREIVLEFSRIGTLSSEHADAIIWAQERYRELEEELS